MQFPALSRTPGLAVAAGLLIAASASAQFSTDFENLKGSSTGVQVNGQEKYYNPVTGSTSFNCFLYANNSYKIPQNPNGKAFFVAATGPGSSVYARTQRNVAYCGDKFTLGFDVLALFTGSGTSADNLGSVSLQPSGSSRYFIALPRWSTVGSTWKMSTVQFNSTGGTVYSDPITAFQGLALNKWYRWEVDFDLKANTITELRLTDLSTKKTVKYQPPSSAPWYLGGGASSTLPRPTGLRLFAGTSTVAGNTLAFDNLSLTLNETGQKAVANIYGSGTGRPNPKGSLVVTGSPVVDTVVQFGIHNPLSTQSRGTNTWLWFSNKKVDPGLMVPGFGMQGGGASGELLIGSLLIGVPGPAWDGSNPSVISARVPINCNLLGVSAYGQGLMVDLTSSKTPVGLTEAVELKVGNVQ